MEVRVDHIGLAVRRLSEAVPMWEGRLGVRASPPEEVVSQKVRVSFLDLGDLHLELLEPTTEGFGVAKFLEKRGEGMHHLAFRVPDIRAELRRLAESGARLIDVEPRKGARGRLVAFVHPDSSHGVLTELVGNP